MCNPTLAVSAAMQLGGAALKNQASKRAARMEASAVEDYGNKNMGLETEARGAVNQVADSFAPDRFSAGQGAETNRLAALFNDTTGIPQQTLPSQGGVPAVIGETMNSELAKAAAFNQQQGAALAELQGFGDFLANRINPQMANSANTVGMMGNMMGGNANVLNADLRNAARSAQSPMGDLLQTAGSVGTQYGLYKG